MKSIDKIQQEIKQLSQRKVELLKVHQQKIKSHEEQKTLYQYIFGQPPLQPDPELQAVNEKIDRLDREKEKYFKILQAAPPVPGRDWSKYPLYSHILMSWNFDYPPDQMGFYLITLTSIGTVSKAYWRSWNIKKAAEMLEKGELESEMLSFHRHFSGLNNEQLMKEAKIMRYIVKLKAFAFTGFLVTGFTAFVQLKNKNRFNK